MCGTAWRLADGEPRAAPSTLRVTNGTVDLVTSDGEPCVTPDALGMASSTVQIHADQYVGGH
jgi:hypothetical protein